MKLTEFLQDTGNPVAYYPKLTNITGGVKETVLLCQLIHWHGKQADEEGWIYKTREELLEETGLSRCEQETARKSLVKKNFIQEKRKGIPAKMYYLINFDAINDAWEEFIITEKTNKKERNQPTRWLETDQQEGDFSANKKETFPPTITDITTKITTKNTTEYISSSKELDLIAPIKYLNQKTGRNFSYTCGSTLRLVRARYKEGRTLDDFIRVIDKKYNDWHNDPKMKTYLRPSTLFNQTKFENYINEIDVTTKTNINTDAITQWINKKGGETNE